ncbi:uncharacterized protein LOC114267797 [Camellia sinensis]|uniref:uncharacterized protein LOC114267797 n=1 Tax=Camellia sinensis TaxID=4442 RepID=UPI00103665EA|nr:uncharacterized protein LOC114267797 [Camellia sinensis]
MEHHQNLTELKAIRSATKSMILSLQKSQIVHQKVLGLRKTARQALAEVEEKTTELKKFQQKMAELEAEVARLTGLVTSAEADKQKALIAMKNKYLRELVKLEGKKDAEIADLKKKGGDANATGFKEVVEFALALQKAGCFSVVLECVLAPVDAAATFALRIPTIIIGVRPFYIGQVN